MKKYENVLTGVLSFSRYHSQGWLFGYIYGLLNWRVIDQKTHDKLVSFVEDYFRKKPFSSYNDRGDQTHEE